MWPRANDVQQMQSCDCTVNVLLHTYFLTLMIISFKSSSHLNAVWVMHSLRSRVLCNFEHYCIILDRAHIKTLIASQVWYKSLSSGCCEIRSPSQIFHSWHIMYGYIWSNHLAITQQQLFYTCSWCFLCAPGEMYIIHPYTAIMVPLHGDADLLLLSIMLTTFSACCNSYSMHNRECACSL